MFHVMRIEKFTQKDMLQGQSANKKAEAANEMGVGLIVM
jgi:hypothetical protein